MKTKLHNNDLGGSAPLMGHWSLRKSQDFSSGARYSNYFEKINCEKRGEE